MWADDNILNITRLARDARVAQIRLRRRLRQKFDKLGAGRMAQPRMLLLRDLERKQRHKVREQELREMVLQQPRRGRTSLPRDLPSRQIET